jgi:hypothetical protein
MCQWPWRRPLGPVFRCRGPVISFAPEWCSGASAWDTDLLAYNQLPFTAPQDKTKALLLSWAAFACGAACRFLHLSKTLPWHLAMSEWGWLLWGMFAPWVAFRRGSARDNGAPHHRTLWSVSIYLQTHPLHCHSQHKSSNSWQRNRLHWF